ncbi:unnamed protein product [Cochlearia groenlandica]
MDVPISEGPTWDQLLEVRVRHVFSISEEEVIPTWADEEEGEDVDKLLNDILDDNFDSGFWDTISKSKKKTFKKRNVDVVVEECNDDDFSQEKKKVV